MTALFVLLACNALPLPKMGGQADTTTPAPAPPMATQELKGHVAVADGRLTVFNDSGEEWTNVIATANDTLVCNLGLVHPNDQAGIQVANCTGGPLAAPIVSVRVAAQQGYLVAAVAPEAAPAEAAPAAAPEAAPEKPAKAASAKAAEPEKPAIKAHAEMSGGFGPARRVTVFNDGAAGWSGCRVTVNDLYDYALDRLGAGEHEGIMMVRFKDKAGNTFTSNANITKVGIRCAEGSTSVTPK